MLNTNNLYSFRWFQVFPTIKSLQVIVINPEIDGNEGVLRIPQSSSITGTSPSICLVSYSGHSFGVSYPSAEVQLV